MNTTAPPPWPSRLIYALLTGTAAAFVAALAIAAVYHQHPSFRLDMDRDLPRTVTGIYPPERQGKTTFAWSGGRVEMAIDHVDRRIAWSCRLDVINWRPASAGPAGLRVESDGRVLLEARIIEPTASLSFEIPPDPDRSTLRVAMAVSPTFRPGPQDPRDLGLAFDGVGCDPAPGPRPWPSTPIMARGAVAAAAAATAIALAGVPLVAALVASAVVAGGQAFSLATGWAAHSLESPPVYLLTGLLLIFSLAPVLAAALLRRTLSTAARLAIVVSACACYLKLLFLLHPNKDVVDALFHAHRLDWVLAGRFYFTQLSTSATPFPYAIGLYLFSAPWSVLTTDHVTLLRIVVCVAEALAGVMLYPMIVGAWNDRAVAVMAVVLFHLVPLPYAVIGNANLTNAFGQSAALVTMAAATTWAFGPGRLLPLAGLTALATLAFLSHVGTLAFLLPTLLVVVLLYVTFGGPQSRGPARAVLLSTALALLLAVGLYYAHFGDVYRPHLEAARARVVVMFGGNGGPGPSARAPDAQPAPAPRPRVAPLRLGIGGAFDQTKSSLGWPIIILAIAGAWRLLARRGVDRLVLSIAAWIATSLGFLTWSAVRVVEPKYVQDAWEFIGRVELATTPAAVILAACGALWAWRLGLASRIVSAALVLAAFVNGARALGAWIF